jgi:hypothetical protein
MINNINKFYFNGVLNENSLHYLIEDMHEYTHVSVTNLLIDQFNQLENEILYLTEGNEKIGILYNDITYNSYEEVITDLENKLNTNSPNNLNYSVDIQQFTNKIIIHSNNNNIQISLLLSEVMKKMYGFINNNITFVHNIIGDLKIFIRPIDNIVIRSNIVSTSSEHNDKNDILTVINYNSLNNFYNYDLLNNSRMFYSTYNIKFEFLTNENIYIDRAARYIIELTFFTFEKLTNINTFINYQLQLINIEQEKQKEKLIEEYKKEEKILQDTTQNQN